MEPIEIPRHIEDPVHILLWSSDELAPIALGLVAGMFLGSPIIGLGCGIVAAYLYKKFLDNRPDGFVVHFLYWQGLVPSKSKTVPNPFVKTYYP